MLTWFIPSFYGDIQLKPTEEKVTEVILEKLSPTEIVAMKTVLEKGVKKGWWASDDIDRDLQAASLKLNAPLPKVQATLTRALKPGRKTISVVKIAGGTIEEVNEATYGEKAAKAAAGTTVAVPTLGCPMPAFDAAEIRARRVTEAFLAPTQLRDFRLNNMFITTGAETGHQYAVISRQNARLMSRFGRSLYDMDEHRAICVHDWTVPAAEEMLGLHLFLSVPGYESYIRSLPEPHRN